MHYLAAITETSPLTFHFSIHNPGEANGPIYVPKLLGPFGYFIEVEAKDTEDQTVYRSTKPKVRLKLHPSRQESYYALEPGYTHGIVFQVEEMGQAAGDYHLKLTYSNMEFTGFSGHSLGEMSFETILPFHIA